MGEKKKYSELVKEERKKGNVVFIAIDSFRSAPVKDFVAQPADGLLWDLNRDEVTALTFMDQEGMIHWVNNFAVALVIRELKSQLAQLEKDKTLLMHVAYGRADVRDLPEHLVEDSWDQEVDGRLTERDDGD